MSEAAQTAARSAGFTPFAALRYRDFAVFAAARLLTTLSWQILGAAVGWQVWQLTRDPLSLAFVGLVQFLPFILLVLPAGQIADRVDRRLVLIGAYAVEASCAGAVVVVHALGRNSRLAGVRRDDAVRLRAARSGCRRARPSRRISCRAKCFPSAVAVNSTLFQIGVIAGPAIGGLLLLWGPQAAYGTVAVPARRSRWCSSPRIKPVRARCARGRFQARAICSKACDSCFAGARCSAPSRWTCSPCCSAVPPR